MVGSDLQEHHENQAIGDQILGRERAVQLLLVSEFFNRQARELLLLRSLSQESAGRGVRFCDTIQARHDLRHLKFVPPTRSSGRTSGRGDNKSPWLACWQLLCRRVVNGASRSHGEADASERSHILRRIGIQDDQIRVHGGGQSALVRRIAEAIRGRGGERL
jgi:hypothetical protein